MFDQTNQLREETVVADEVARSLGYSVGDRASFAELLNAEQRIGKRGRKPVRSIVVPSAGSHETVELLARTGRQVPPSHAWPSAHQADVLSFCPVPIREWQSLACEVLEAAAKAWQIALRQLIDEWRALGAPPIRIGIRSVPFLRFLSPDLDGVSESELTQRLHEWVHVTVTRVDSARMLEGAMKGHASLYVLRRPFVAWPAVEGRKLEGATGQRRVLTLQRPKLVSEPETDAEVVDALDRAATLARRTSRAA